MKVKSMRSFMMIAFATILLAGSALLGNVEVKAAETTYDVTDYGADGRDTESDWRGIQRALDLARDTSGGATVYIPDGTYYLDARLDIYSDTTLKLSSGAVMKRAAGTEEILLANAADDGLEYGGYERTSNITISGGTWDGYTSNPSEKMNVIYIGHASDVTICDTTIKNSYSAHLLELTGVQNASVENVTFEGFIAVGDATDDSYKEALQLDSVTEETSEHYAPYDGTMCDNITITGCTFTDYPCAIGTHTEYDNAMTNISITNNSFFEIRNYVINLYNYKDFIISNNVQETPEAYTPVMFVNCENSNGKISGNTIVGTQKTPLYLYNSKVEVIKNKISNIPDNGIQITNGSNVTATNNTITDVTKNGINVAGTGTAVLNGNTIRNCKGSAIYGASGSVLTADANVVSNCKGSVICAEGASVAKITNNKIFDSSTYGIYVSSGNANTLIEGNEVDVTAEYGITVQGATNSAIKNNTIKSAKKYAIYLRESLSDVYTSNVTISGNTITGDAIAEGTAAIFVRKANGVNIKNNTLSAYAFSIYVAPTCSSSVVTGNSYNSQLGVYDETATVSNNTAYTSVEVKEAADGNWYYYVNGLVDTTYTGFADMGDEWWRVENGKVNFNYTKLMSYKGTWYYVRGGIIDFAFDGIASNEKGTFYIENSVVDFSKNGVLQRGSTWYYFKGGQVQYVNSVEKNSSGWWYIKNGKVDFSFDGVAKNSTGTWYIENGKVDFSKSGVYRRGNTWYYFKGGQVQFINSVEKNSSGWWYIKNGKVDFSYDGVGKNSAGTWYIENGKVDFSKTGVYRRGNAWYYFKGGMVQRVNSVEKNSSGWWCIKNGQVDFGFTGIAKNASGSWYIKKGQVDFGYSGTYKFQGKTYKVVKGKATIVK